MSPCMWTHDGPNSATNPRWNWFLLKLFRRQLQTKLHHESSQTFHSSIKVRQLRSAFLAHEKLSCTFQFCPRDLEVIRAIWILQTIQHTLTFPQIVKVLLLSIWSKENNNPSRYGLYSVEKRFAKFGFHFDVRIVSIIELKGPSVDSLIQDKNRLYYGN